MKVDTKTLPPSARRSVRGSYMTRLSGDGIVVQSWPRKRGMAKQGYPLYQQIEFGMAARMAADPGNDARILAEYWAKGSQMVWRDVQQKLILGVFWDIELADGTRLESWRMGNGNPLYWLDLISSTPGAIVYRSGIGWIALLPGAAGKVLTISADGVTPTWSTPAAGGGASPDFSPPKIADFPVIIGSPVTVDSALGLGIQGQAAHDRWDGIYKTFAGGSDHTFSARLVPNWMYAANQSVGVSLRDSASGKILTIGTTGNNSGTQFYEMFGWNSPTSVNSGLGAGFQWTPAPLWVRGDWHAATHTLDGYTSWDGVNWTSLGTTNFLPAATHVGFGVGSRDASNRKATGSVTWWSG